MMTSQPSSPSSSSRSRRHSIPLSRHLIAFALLLVVCGNLVHQVGAVAAAEDGDDDESPSSSSSNEFVKRITENSSLTCSDEKCRDETVFCYEGANFIKTPNKVFYVTTARVVYRRRRKGEAASDGNGEDHIVPCIDAVAQDEWSISSLQAGVYGDPLYPVKTLSTRIKQKKEASMFRRAMSGFFPSFTLLLLLLLVKKRD